MGSAEGQRLRPPVLAAEPAGGVRDAVGRHHVEGIAVAVLRAEPRRATGGRRRRLRRVAPAGREPARETRVPPRHASSTTRSGRRVRAATVMWGSPSRRECQRPVVGGAWSMTSRSTDWIVSPAALLDAFVETSDDAMVSHDAEGNVTTWNQTAERLFGYPAPRRSSDRPTPRCSPTTSATTCEPIVDTRDGGRSGQALRNRDPAQGRHADADLDVVVSGARRR